MLRNLFADRNPDILMSRDVIQHFVQRADPARTSNDAKMQAQAHHACAVRLRFCAQNIERGFGVIDSHVGGEGRIDPELHVVRIDRVGHHHNRIGPILEMWRPLRTVHFVV